MNQNRIETMRQGREIPQVTLQKYNQLRSRNPGSLICAFEGADDVTFYDVMIKRIQEFTFIPFICKGKDKVFDLRVILSRNTAVDSNQVLYFIDFDFDGLKNHMPGPDLYCTPSYSFENLLVNKIVLNTLLQAEYRCADENGDVDIDRIAKLFDARLHEFIECMREPNHLIYFARISGIKLSDINEDLKKYISVRLDLVKSVADYKECYQLVGYDSEPDSAKITACKDQFDKLAPYMAWRGKFIFLFFRKFLSDLKEDRGSQTPTYFTTRANMSFSPGSDVIRIMASITPVPECLRSFVLNFVNSKS